MPSPKAEPYIFLGEYVHYRNIHLPEGGTLVARKGDIREFTEPPPGLWVRYVKPKAEKAGE